MVAVATYSSAVEAQLEKARLEACGIPCHVQGDSSTGLGFGPIKLVVPEAAAAEAAALLEFPESSPPEESSGDERKTEPLERCLVCQSPELEIKQPPFVVRVVRALLLQVLPIPEVWLASRTLRCQVCGHEWKAGPRTEDTVPPPFDA